jgi:3-phosphoshikimate 1-carboxyvinyltransferase
VSGELQPPGDKSISHRALILAAIAGEQSRIRGILESDDVEATARCLRALGYPIPPLSSDVLIVGGASATAASAGQSDLQLDCGNSGTTARLLAGLAATRERASVLTGDASLQRRPMGRVADPLRLMGASVEWLAEPERLPMRVCRGPRPLTAIDYALPVASAQVKSAVLLAGLVSGVSVRVTEPVPTRDHTERMLIALGARLRMVAGAVLLEPNIEPRGMDLRVPSDPSSAAFFVALALLATSGKLLLRNVLLNPTRTGFLRVLERMGARVVELGARDVHGERVGDLAVTPHTLSGTAIGGAEVATLIDEIPILAALAVRARGETVVRDAAELRVKESDRIATLVDNLRAVGAQAEQLPDGLRVTGLGPGAPLGGHVATHGDHRIAMTFAILGAVSGGQISLDDPTCVNVSYPAFWTDLARVSG